MLSAVMAARRGLAKLITNAEQRSASDVDYYRMALEALGEIDRYHDFEPYSDVQAEKEG